MVDLKNGKLVVEAVCFTDEAGNLSCLQVGDELFVKKEKLVSVKVYSGDKKTCRKCHVVFPLHDFHLNKASSDGHKDICRLCSSEASRIAYHRKKQKTCSKCGAVGSRDKFPKTGSVCKQCSRKYHREYNKKRKLAGLVKHEVVTIGQEERPELDVKIVEIPEKKDANGEHDELKTKTSWHKFKSWNP